MKFSLSSIALGFIAICHWSPAAASPVEPVGSHDVPLALLHSRETNPLGYGPYEQFWNTSAEGTHSEWKRQTGGGCTAPVGSLSAWMLHTTACTGTPATTWVNPGAGACLKHVVGGVVKDINRLKWDGAPCVLFLYNSDDCTNPIGAPQVPACYWSVGSPFRSFRVLC
ncbi:hypothetical protein QBC34DRAFT_42343 [Podospora aff. communis PSN243]|uniref:Secreted protein n=1 Tax=Podospora aff. communis PSN243 TaxID=3040156 RepID=A0AAV9GW01_9PEZI|nr:hypothetical protein QBC34DRAFT_42343 [Podospora aff. communis PSN243]